MRSPILPALVLLLSHPVLAAEDAALPTALADWSGEWRASADLNRMLGFAADDDRVEATTIHPKSFRLTLDDTLGASLEADVLRTYGEQVFARIEHRIVATGQWRPRFGHEESIGPAAFVTRHDGATYLWCDAAYAVVYGAKVSFARGVDRARDVMILDFAAVRTDVTERSPDTVAFQRATPRTSGLRPGRYTGASQLMLVNDDGGVTFDDTPPGIAHLEITEADELRASFPDVALRRGKWHDRTLELSTTEPRVTWEASDGDETFRAIAVPYSERAYLVRLEVRRGEKLVAGARQFYALEKRRDEE